jgi:hypothetical protein
MSHPDYADTLGCGCICAGYMEQDLVSARRREREFRNRCARRSYWLRRKWRVSARGNQYLNVDGFNVVVYPRRDGQGQGWRLTHKATGITQFSARPYETEAAAKLAAFDVMHLQEQKI